VELSTKADQRLTLYIKGGLKMDAATRNTLGLKFFYSYRDNT
jgi:hypothetical protein